MLKHLISYQIFLALIFGVESPKSSFLKTEYGFIDYKNRIILARGASSIIERRSKTGDLEIIEKNLKISKIHKLLENHLRLFYILSILMFLYLEVLLI